MASYLRAVFLIAASVAISFPLQAQNKIAQLIVGKWQPVEAQPANVVIEFTSDGKLLITIGEKTLRGSYRVLDEKNIEVSLEPKGKPQTEKLQVAFQRDEMTTLDSRGNKDTFRRIK